ncbi:MAG: DUF6677 family protein [Thermoguttaceae bacterium]
MKTDTTSTPSPELPNHHTLPLTSDEALATNLNLRNTTFAALLAWLIPGAGHFYQRRFAKATIFFICIISIWVIGIVLGSSHEVGIARTVYCSWRDGDRRLYFIPQAGLGLSAVPAVIQSYLCDNANMPSPLGRFMAPPLLGRSGAAPTGDEIVRKLNIWYDLGTLFTVVAGLMNLLAVFDAMAGPVFVVTTKRK